jgi:hypothetical protein
VVVNERKVKRYSEYLHGKISSHASSTAGDGGPLKGDERSKEPSKRFFMGSCLVFTKFATATIKK